MNYYYRDKADQGIGPLTLDALAKLRFAGVLDGDTSVRVADSADWKPCREIIADPSHSPQSQTATAPVAKSPLLPVLISLVIVAALVAATGYWWLNRTPGQHEPAKKGATEKTGTTASDTTAAITIETIVGEWRGSAHGQYAGSSLVIRPDKSFEFKTTSDTYRGTAETFHGGLTDKELKKIVGLPHFVSLGTLNETFTIDGQGFVLALLVNGKHDDMRLMLYRVHTKLYAWGGGDSYFERISQ